MNKPMMDESNQGDCSIGLRRTTGYGKRYVEMTSICPSSLPDVMLNVLAPAPKFSLQFPLLCSPSSYFQGWKTDF